jgi:L-methionine (R)-S-oxide reductase
MDSEILSNLAELSKSAADRDELLREAVKLVKTARSYYNWVGIYLVDGDFLSLHNFIGKPTDHTRIPIGVGVCGAAVADKENKIVGDVHAIDNYLACSVETSSEIVVLIRRDDRIFGQIDIDSDLKNAFASNDEDFLGRVADILAARF